MTILNTLIQCNPKSIKPNKLKNKSRQKKESKGRSHHLDGGENSGCMHDMDELKILKC